MAKMSGGMHMSPGAVDADIERIPPRSPRRSAASSPATEFSPRASPSLTSSPSRSPGIVLTKEDGTRVRVPRSVLEAATIATAASPGSKFQKILIFDSGFGGLDMCVELALLGLCALIHIKGAHALFPKEALDDALRGHPGGSHLEMETTIKGIKFIAIGYKYNSKKSLFFLCAGGTGDGEYYVTKWPDSDGNILTRNVVRLVLASRYFTKNGASSARKRPRTTALRRLAGSALCAERQAAAAGITRNAIATSSTSNEAALVSNHKLNSLCSPLHQRSDLASAAQLLGFRLEIEV